MTWCDSMTDGIVRMKEDKKLWGVSFCVGNRFRAFFFPEEERKKKDASNKRNDETEKPFYVA